MHSFSQGPNISGKREIILLKKYLFIVSVYLEHYRKTVINYHCKDFLFNLTLSEYWDNLGTWTYLSCYCLCRLSVLLVFHGHSHNEGLTLIFQNSEFWIALVFHLSPTLLFMFIFASLLLPNRNIQYLYLLNTFYNLEIVAFHWNNWLSLVEGF